MFRTVGDPAKTREAVLAAVAGRAEALEVFYTPAVQLAKVDGLPTTVVAFTTDIPSFEGTWGQPYLIGPGSIHVAHTSEERGPKTELSEAVDIYARLATQLLSTGRASAWASASPLLVTERWAGSSSSSRPSTGSTCAQNSHGKTICMMPGSAGNRCAGSTSPSNSRRLIPRRIISAASLRWASTRAAAPRAGSNILPPCMRRFLPPARVSFTARIFL